MAPPPTVVALKQRFLGTQTRALSQPLAPSRAWRTSSAQAGPDTDENETGGGSNSRLPDKAVDDALFRLNHALQQHARRVYAPQATRHVAEQIDGLYWNAAGEVLDGGVEGEGEGDGGESVAAGLGVGADLAAHETITTLPLSWDDAGPPRHARETAAYPSEAQRYSELATHLQTLDGERQRALARVARLRRLHALLQPFATSTPSGSDGDGDGGDGGAVQDNLVTRNGDVEAELQRMRMLLVRVGGRVGQLATVPASVPEPTTAATTSGDGDDDAMDVSVDVDEGSTAEQQRRVGMLLDRF
ncbi:kinetochore Sim4 complex subunit Fta4 [Lasiosphaeria ovina]|uniref:Kinetochore Sim4 complex subunit Fta4 n=1 Tax=Lasiosphaeria ovina TaxID=92902 RepID=A0AAE0KC14_9PEZI|nr:kinetochore Sim4 complex subunit Fta4 [Lasiosphaeria ovina]